MKEAFSEANSKSPGSTRTVSMVEFRASEGLEGEEEDLVGVDLGGGPEVTRRAWQKWPFFGTSKGSSVSLRSLSLPPTD